MIWKGIEQQSCLQQVTQKGSSHLLYSKCCIQVRGMCFGEGCEDWTLVIPACTVGNSTVHISTYTDFKLQLRSAAHPYEPQLLLGVDQG